MHHAEETGTTRDRIIETALKLFSREGYLGATTREIAREAGVAEVTLFRHFPTKEQLFEETITRHSFLPTLKGLLPEIVKMPYEDALALIARRYLEALAMRKDMIKIMHSEMQRYPEKVRTIFYAFIDEMVNTIASYFKGLQDKGVLREFDTEFGARAFLGMFFSYFNSEEILLRRKFRHVDADSTIREYVKIFAVGTLK
ncbi:MAG TPA: TetR/AcrR family transcriptional regulator [Dissulfurispiraceae bacterium]